MFLQHFEYFCYHSNHTFHATEKKDMHNQHIVTFSHTKFYQGGLKSYVKIRMFLHNFDYEKNDLHNQHIAICSDTKFHQASVNSFLSYRGDPDFIKQTEGKPIVPSGLNTGRHTGRGLKITQMVPLCYQC